MPNRPDETVDPQPEPPPWEDAAAAFDEMRHLVERLLPKGKPTHAAVLAASRLRDILAAVQAGDPYYCPSVLEMKEAWRTVHGTEPGHFGADDELNWDSIAEERRRWRDADR